MRVAIQHEKMHGALYKIVIAFITGQGKIIQIWLCICSNPIMVAKGREKFIDGRAVPIRACIGMYKLVLILADVVIYGAGGPAVVIIIAKCNDEIRVPAFNFIGDIQFSLSSRAIIPDHCKMNGRRVGDILLIWIFSGMNGDRCDQECGQCYYR